MAQVETVTLSKQYDICSISNGGFYPPQQVAEFQHLYYPNSLRKFEAPNYPIRATASACKLREHDNSSLAA